MKKIFFSLLILFAVALTSSASELLNIPYKNIKEEDKIKLNNDVWTNKISDVIQIILLKLFQMEQAVTLNFIILTEPLLLLQDVSMNFYIKVT